MKYAVVALVSAAVAGFGFFAGLVGALCETGPPSCPSEGLISFYEFLFFAGASVCVSAAVLGVWRLIKTRKLPDAGWYPDPDAPDAAWRYWDGHSWTDHRAPRS